MRSRGVPPRHEAAVRGGALVPAPCAPHSGNSKLRLARRCVTNLAASGAIFGGVALAAPPPGPPSGPPGALHEWFERQHAVSGVWCCNVADGHVLDDRDWRLQGTRFEVRIAGDWHGVPASALRDPAGGENRTGGAVVWFLGTGATLRIFCFAPGELY